MERALSSVEDSRERVGYNEENTFKIMYETEGNERE